jgi:serine/threonine-protein kinase HipA
MTRRFDRVTGTKLHMQSLCAIAHYDFNLAGAYGYEQALMTMRRMKLSKKEQLQQYRRMVFNVIARNQDDHTKNIAFLMNPQGEWSLSPAFDMTHSYKPGEGWTQTHQMSINGKRDHFTRQDLIDVAHSNDLKNPEKVIADVIKAVEQWPTFAAEAGVSQQKIDAISKDHRLALV